MKKFKILLAICSLFVLVALATVGVFATSTQANPAQTMEMRGLWVTSAYNLDWPSRQGLTPTQLRAEIDDILNRAAAQGINAVFVQVRPVGDALYRSEIFPWSHLISGTQGVAPAENFDPLEYWVYAAHAMGIEVHAWLNPYRVTFPNQRITNPAELSANHPARLNPSLVIAYNNSLFFDPGNPAARQLIIDGAEELLRNFNIDGIHLDDYFYPSRYFPDQATFARYGGGMNIHDWRRENVNTLIRDLQAMTREANPNAAFGVSPTAIWMNNTTDPRGSDTRGFESFHGAYADTRRWVTEGWVDYIVPQIYWYHGFAPASYDVVLGWWEDVVRGTDVRLYVGLAVYREVEGRANWDGEILRQLERNARSTEVRGSIFFRERFMRNSIGDSIGAFYARHLPGQVPTIPGNRPVTSPTVTTPPIPIIPLPTTAIVAASANSVPTVTMDTLTVTQPSANRSVTDANGFFMFGSALPNVPVYVNGNVIENRTAEGFFSVFLPLERGANSFTFTQAGQEPVTRVITNNAPAGVQQPARMETAAVTNPFPSTVEYARQGSTITLRATAPAGATVTAQVGGQTINMTQSNANLQSTPGNIVAAQFTGNFTLGTQGADNGITTIGSPVYTATWNGLTLTATAPGQIRSLGPVAPFFAEVVTSSAWVFPGATTTGGSGFILAPGQIDRIVAVSGDWTRLASGGWVQTEHLRHHVNESLVPQGAGFLSNGQYIIGDNRHYLQWTVSGLGNNHPAIYAEFDGNELIVTFGMWYTAPPIDFDTAPTMFSEIRVGTHNNAPAYFMVLNEDARLEGFYVDTSASGVVRLVLVQRRQLTPGRYPFTGFTFVIDAGHGGTDSGAIGPMGPSMSESDIVLAQANLLETRLASLGANVVRIRNTDSNYTLQQRVALSKNASPDMFLSLHTNSTAETTDATNIRGFTVWYRNPNSNPAATVFMNTMYNVNPGTNRSAGPNQANFFVCRPQWAPHILLEASFTNNIQDFAWMINPNRMNDYVWAIANSLLAYYS